MRIALLDIDKFVSLNNLEEITNPITLDRGFVTTPDGLLSTEIFGTSTISRKQTFAYIDLHCHVFHPVIYKAIKRMDRRIDAIIGGTAKFSIDKDGQIVEDENGQTGIDWLYDNWSKIKWKRNDSKIRNSRIDLIEQHKKSEIFQSKEIVCPAFYRDVNLQSSKSGKPSIHVINRMYARIIQLAMTLNTGAFSFSLNYTKFNIQKLVIELYDWFKGRIEKKRGIIKQQILGKSVDYGSRIVISASDATYNKVDDMVVDFYHAGVPISYCISGFAPFFVGWIQQYFANEFESVGMKYPVYDKSLKKTVWVQLKNPMLQFSDEKIKDMMHEYLYSYDTRFRPLEIETMDPKYKTIHIAFKGRNTYAEEFDPDDTDQLLARRPFTLTDLMYIAAVDITKDKHVYITRYPMADHLGIFPIGINVLSTIQTTNMILDDTEYKHYPVVDLESHGNSMNKFIEVLQLSNVYLSAIGGDYDGDQITMKGVFSQEANAEAERIMKAYTNILGINGTNVRSTTIEAIQTLYSISMWKNPDKKFDTR